MNDKILAKKFGCLVRKLRSEIGLSQEAFADQCGLHRTYIGSIERGEKTVTIETASKLAKALGITLTQLFSQLETNQDSNENGLN